MEQQCNTASLGSAAALRVLPKRTIVLGRLVAILLLGSSLRFSGLGDRGLWGDELWTADGCSEPTLAAMVDNFSRHHQLPISLSFFAARFSLELGADSPSRDLWLRLPTALAGILGIALTFALGRILLGTREAMFAAFLLAISAFHVRHSQIARYYGIYMALTTLAMYLFWKAWTTKRWPWWVGFTLASIAGNYTHFLAAFVPFVCALFAVTVSACRVASAARGKDGGRILRGELRSLMPVALSGMAILAAWVPIVPMVLTFWSSPVGAGAGSEASITLSPGLFVTLVSHFADEYRFGLATAVLLSIFLVGFGSLARWKRQVAWFALLLFLVPLLILCAIQPGHNFGGKYVIFMLPAFFLVVAEGIASLHRTITHPARLRRLRQTAILPGFVLLGLSLVSYSSLHKWYSLPMEDWRGAAAYLQTHAQAGDVVVCDGQLLGAGGDYARTRIGLSLYLDTEALQVRLVRERQAADVLPQAADRPQRVWGVIWHKQPLKRLATDSVLVKQFEQVTILRTATPAPQSMREELREILVTLLSMQPLAEAKADLLLALQELYACDAEQYPPGAVEGTPAELEAALEACARASGVPPGGSRSAQDYYDRGQELAQAGQWGAASAELAQAVALAPEQGTYHLAYGWSLFRTSASVELARAELNRAAERIPDSPWPHLYLAEIALAEGEPDGALRSAQQAVELKPDLFSGWALQGQALRRMGRLQEAEQSLQHAIELAPDKPAPHAEMGCLLEQQKRLDEAVQAYERAVELAPGNAAYCLYLAAAYRAWEHLPQAIAAYQRALELDPGNPVAEKALQALSP
jgi:tetratricopeptide (TPR) repeat protein